MSVTAAPVDVIRRNNSFIKFTLYPSSIVQAVIFTARNEVGARLCFYRCVWFCSQGGGSTWPGTPPQTRYTPWPGTPSWHQVHLPLGPGTPPGIRYTPRPGKPPLGPGTPPRTRYTPQTRYAPGTPPGPGTLLLDQVHPPGPGTPPRTRYTPQVRYTPLDQVHLPGPGTPPGPGTSPRTRYTPPGPGTPPGTREIRSTRGRYASYWNAFLFCLFFNGESNRLYENLESSVDSSVSDCQLPSCYPFCATLVQVTTY